MLRARSTSTRIIYGTTSRALRQKQPPPLKATRHLSTQVVQPTAVSRSRVITLTSLAVLGYGTLSYLKSSTVYNEKEEIEAVLERAAKSLDEIRAARAEEAENLVAYVWGSNKNQAVSRTESNVESVRSPKISTELSGHAFRDLVMQEQYAAYVDDVGNVYQWGAEGSIEQPIATLKDKDIVSLAASSSKLFALSRNGTVYTLPTTQATVPTSAVTTDVPLQRGEKITSISAGNDHLLALTSNGRTFVQPLSRNANSHGQLGIPANQRSQLTGLVPLAELDPYADKTRMTRPSKNTSDNSSPFVCDTLYEVPALRGVHIEQIAAGGRTSYARRAGGGVLAWGANEYGQLAQGANCLASIMAQPTEIPLGQTYPSGSSVRCTNIAAGGDVVFMTVTQAENSSPRPLVDILAAGMGRWGTLGNALFTHAQSTPVRVKTISGVLEYDEATQQLEPLRPHTISVSPSSHVFVTLSPRHQSQGSGHDLLAFGANTEYQLGNGKRGSVAIPSYLPGQHGEERWMLHGQRRVKVPNPGSWMPWSKTKTVQVEQRAVAGWNCGVVYWKIISP